MKCFITTLLLLLIANITYSQTNNFTIEDVMSAPMPTDLIGHPTADKFAWVFNDKGSRNVWLYEDGASRAITTYEGDNGQGISGLSFSKVASTLMFHRGGAPNSRGELPNPTTEPLGVTRDIMEYDMMKDTLVKVTEGHSAKYAPHEHAMIYIKKGAVWHYNLESGEEKQLFKTRGGVGQLSWHPMGEAIAFRSSRGDHSFIGIYKFENGEIEFVSPSVDLDQHPVWSPDGTQLAFMKMANAKNVLPFMPIREASPWSIHVHNYGGNYKSNSEGNSNQTKSTIEIWKAKEGEGSAYRSINAERQLMWSKSGRLIFAWELNEYTNLYSIASDGQGSPLPLTPGPYEVQFVTLGHDDMIYASSNKGDVDRQHIYKVDPATGEKAPMTEGVGIEWRSATNGAGKVACLSSSYDKPAQPWIIYPQQELMAATELPETWPTDHLVQPEQVVFTASDGIQIHGQLFKPKSLAANSGSSAGQRHPAVIFFHGGSRRQMLLGFHHSGYYHNAYALNQYLADQGYVVLSVNYRSGIGYGMKFREALDYGATGASEYNDVIGAGLYLQSRDDVLRDKIGLWGGSYGGYLTALGLARASDVFAAGVDIHGVHDWNVVIKNFVPDYNAEKRAAYSALAYESSPMADIAGWRSPVLVIHGDDDRNVPFSESVDLVESLRPLGVHIEQLIFPDEVHGFLLHKNWLSAYKATADFFNRMIGGRSE